MSYINNQLGGINGRKLTMQTCFTDETPATATKCGNQAVAAHPDIIVSGENSEDQIDASIANKAGIPFLVYNGSTDSLNAFRFTDDQLGPAIAAGILAKQRGLHSLTVIALNFPIVTNALSVAAPVIKSMGLDFKTVLINYGTADQSAQWEAATQGNTGAIVLEEDPTDCAATAKAKATLGFNGLFIFDINCAVPAVIAAGGSSLNGSLVLADSAAANLKAADTKTYLAALKKYQPSVIKNGLASSPNAANQFQVFMNIYKVLKPISNPSSLNAKKIMTALRGAKAVPVFMGGGATFTCNRNQVKSEPALCSLVQTYGKFSNGKVSYTGPLGNQVVAAIKKAGK